MITKKIMFYGHEGEIRKKIKKFNIMMRQSIEQMNGVSTLIDEFLNNIGN